jgi:hypothetical protein
MQAQTARAVPHERHSCHNARAPLALRIHVSLPEKVSAKTLYRWVTGMRREYKLSQTALTLLETLIDKCRVSDFDKGSLCGSGKAPVGWLKRSASHAGAQQRREQLIKAGLIARTTIGKGRASGSAARTTRSSRCSVSASRRW